MNFSLPFFVPVNWLLLLIPIPNLITDKGLKSCPKLNCVMACPFGLKTDENNCTICECANVCLNHQCPLGQNCTEEKGHCRKQNFCYPIPKCSSTSGYIFILHFFFLFNTISKPTNRSIGLIEIYCILYEVYKYWI